MNLPKLAPLSPLPGRGDGPRIARRVCCERIICAHNEDEERGWWHDLERADWLLFADGGRIVESSLQDLAGSIEEAVTSGYRPVVFVDGMQDWAPATTALGRHQAFGSIYVRGRDDDLMSQLLHNPSDEILAITRGAGRLSVPTLEYGQALEDYLEVRLEDFQLVKLDDSSPLMPKLRLTCRLNPFRYIDATLYCRNGRARLQQKYQIGDDASVDDPPCDRPVRFRDWWLDFSTSNPINTSTAIDKPTAFMEAFTKTFDLPLAFQGWEAGGEPPWRALLQRLNEMSHGVMEHLTPVHQALLRLLDEDTLKDGLETLQSALLGDSTPIASVRGAGERTHKAEGVEAPPFPVLIREVDGDRSKKHNRTVFTVSWLESNRPEQAPTVIVELDGGDEPREPVTGSWGENLSTLTLTTRVDEHLQLGWVWDPERNTLRVSLLR